MWHGGRYRIERELGAGANGKVYLVRRDNAVYAMKIGTDTLDLQSEANILKVLSGMDGSFRHFLTDVDDYREDGKSVPFYVMKYVEGRQLQDYLTAKGQDWFPLVGLRLLGLLRELHNKGYVFGDLKKENVLVSGYGQVELVDFGGVTPMGKSVKQFTEIYDRGYWNAGDRSADMAYDIFSFAILCIHVCGGAKSVFAKGVLPQNRSADNLLEEAAADPQCSAYMPFLAKALKGGYASSGEAYSDWQRILRLQTGIRPPGVHGKGAKTWVTVGFAASLLLFAATVWYYW